jgi:lipopolysaccharide/colanic/teichoic acid biosynthesis glycosyltransferase
MELLLHVKKNTEKLYRHFNLPTEMPVLPLADRRKEFLYIGACSQIVDMLVSVLDSGYAADSVEKAEIVLKKILSSNGHCPDFMVIDGWIGLPAIEQLYKFIAEHTLLQQIPLLVDASFISHHEALIIGQSTFVDEVVALKEVGRPMLIAKLKLLKKIKSNQSRSELHKKIDTHLPDQTYQLNTIKRFFDIVLSTACLLFLSPLFLLIAIAIKIESRGPVFYISKRAGCGYKIFSFYKFRTMEIGADEKVNALSGKNAYVPSAEGQPVFFKINNDPRVTKVGCFLRNLSLDELPQLINVWLGDMSLVGNRPLPLYEAQTLTTDEWAARFMAPAGITGLWQIKKRGQEDMSTEERIHLDITYAEKNNFMYDLWIMANTPPALIQKTNA